MVVGSPTSAPQARSVATATIVPIGGRISPDMIASLRDDVMHGPMAIRPIVGVVGAFFQPGIEVLCRQWSFLSMGIDDKHRASSPASHESPKGNRLHYWSLLRVRRGAFHSADMACACSPNR